MITLMTMKIHSVNSVAFTFVHCWCWLKQLFVWVSIILKFEQYLTQNSKERLLSHIGMYAEFFGWSKNSGNNGSTISISVTAKNRQLMTNWPLSISNSSQCSGIVQQFQFITPSLSPSLWFFHLSLLLFNYIGCCHLSKLQHYIAR